MKQRYQIDYLEFPSKSVLDSHRFFAEAFGWSFTSYGPSYEAINDAGIDAGIDASEGRTEKPLAVIRTEDLELAEREVLAGRRRDHPGRPSIFPGGRRFHFREPGGNELAVWIEKA